MPAVSNPRRTMHPFRSPQLALIDVGPDEWRLYWRAPEYKPQRRQSRTPGVVQLPLFDLEPMDLVVGGETRGQATLRTHLHLLDSPPSD